ncbi:hypothetical protein MATL_G00165680 [Megalops atlanticus]|uniref:Centromere protein F-like n=1 Tax=Megalops atlanticus TaxID=7932 RepID=A0A9D3PQ26_MEGAT|nr:hypothetical protein MATL_G00165680 [Megalops atlanticus]
MSWELEDWVAGLSGRALQKVRELQDQQERLQRERQQRQVQLDSAEAALNKQKLKYEEARAELAGVQRDLHSTQEEVQAGARVQDRMTQELQVKQAQVCSLQGQLVSARSLSHSLAQEVKRLKAELEKLQNASSSGDSVPSSTPCWNTSTPQEHNSSRCERNDGHGGGTDGKHVRQQLQFLDRSPKAALAGASSVYPRQLHSTLPSRCSTGWKDHSTSSGVFPWEREEASSVSRGRPATLSPSGGDVPDHRGHRDCGKEDLSNENEIQRSQILKLQTWVQSLEQEIHSASDQLRESETRLAEVQGDLAARDQNLNRAREELDWANTQIEKERDRAQMAEQRVKQLQDELSCQRQNAESSRCSAEQRRKDLEREHQRELSELEKERQCMKRQHQQESSKLNQELQQARTLHNTLQAQYEKVLLQKQSVEKYMDTVKGKLEWTEKELQEAQKKETQTQSRLMEALRERDGLSVSMEQSSQQARGLEEEVKRLTEELAEVLSTLAEVQAKLAIPAAPVAPVRFTPAGDNFLCSVPPTYDRRHCPPHAQRKKAERQNRVKEEDLEHRVKYLADKVPGEGIDSEHTRGVGPSMQERPRGERGRARCTEDGGGSLLREEEDERGENKKHSGICEAGVPDTRSKEEDETAPRVTAKVQKQGCSNGDADTPVECICTSSRDLHSMPSLEDLRRENVDLLDKLREAERELELRLEDLQTQRMAESEARTKLKQLSHTHSSLAEQLRHKTQELWEERERLEKQLEEERSKSSRLTEALATLELDFRREQMEREKEKAMERAKSDKLTADMAVLESELRKTQEDRERERKEEEGHRSINEEHRRALMERLIELEMELEEWRGRWQNVNDGAKKTFKLLALGYSTNENFNNSDIAVLKDNDVIPSPNECSRISDSANQQKTLETGKINSITKEAGHTVEPPRQKTVVDLGTPLIDRGKEEQMKLESATDSDETIMLLLEVERLWGACEAMRGERDQEAGRAKQAQARLEVLQSQVTSQTKQLSLAFEKQSRHIEDLLEELQDRDNALQRLEEEVRGCRQEIAQLNAEKQELKLESESFGEYDTEELISEIKALQQQLVELQSQVSSLRAENSRQEEELELWRLMGETISSQPTRDGALQPGNGSIAVVHEDHLLLTCKGNKLVGSTLMAANTFRQSGAEGNCQELLLSAPAEKDASKGGQCHGHSYPADRTPGPPDGTDGPLVAAQLFFQEPFMKDLKSKAVTRKDMEKGTKTEEKSNDIGHEVSITEHSDEECKEIGREVCHASVQTEALDIQELQDSAARKEVEMEITDSLPLSPTGAGEGGAGLLFSRSFPIPADPARLAQRIRRNRNRMSAAFDDTEYEPYGLPEVVMKGFADIPSGPACPYVLRRGLLGTHTLPLSLRKQAEDEGGNPDPDL